MITLTVEDRVAHAEVKKTAAIKGHYNGLVMTLQRGGFSDLKGKLPSTSSPIPNRVLYSISGKRPTGEAAYIRGMTSFGNNVYAMQAIAGTVDESQQFLAVLNSLQDLPGKARGRATF